MMHLNQLKDALQRECRGWKKYEKEIFENEHEEGKWERLDMKMIDEGVG
jgi:hypothetical protein